MVRKARKFNDLVANSQAVLDDIADETAEDFTVNAPLSETKRKTIPTKKFAIPDSRKYPIDTAKRAATALGLVGMHGSPEEKSKVRAKVAAEYPGVGNSGDTNEDDDDDDDDDATTNAAEPLTALVVNQMQTLTANLDTVHLQYRKLDGQNYMVAPMVMITEGVHAGSNGPLMYAAKDLSKTPQLWDHKPVTINHPSINGQPVSACTPEAIENQKVGMILNTVFKNAGQGQPARLHAEAWFIPEKLKRVDERVYNAIKQGQRVEVSTGLFTDMLPSTGVWNKEYYDAVATNFRADHLAVLPDEKGSCSIEDGAGLMRNAKGQTNNKSGVTMNKRSLINSVIANEHMEFDESNRGILEMFDEEFLAKLLPPVTNDEMGNNDEVLDAKGQLAAKKGGKTQKGSPQDAGESNDGALKTKPKLIDGKPDYVPDVGTTLKGRKQTEDDIGPDGSQPDGSGIRNQEYDMYDPELTDNTDPDSMDITEYVSNLQAPPAIKQALLANARLIENQKQEMKETILANERNIFTEDYLNTLTSDELEGLAALAEAQAPTANVEQQANGILGVSQRSVPVLTNSRYAGMYAGVGSGRQQAFGREEKTLDIPTLNFSKRDRDKKMDGDQGDDENTDSDD